ncbi:MAG: serine/threonine protein kinase [Deltaproteobacteria bacterium]|nr:serine/threonine protein kinase [Deltaproteobacteria bacterium]
MSSGARSRISTRFRRGPTRYVPMRRLALGGMAEVWRGEAILDGGDRHPIAIKRVLPHLAQDPMYRSMFQDEARLGMLLRHENIVRVYDARDVGGTFIMILELVDGTMLKSILDRAHARGAGMPVATALHLCRELLRALQYAHDAVDEKGKHLGIIHRDVSPHNLLLGKDGGVKLADFGLADASVHETSMGGGMLGGKLGYLAPEIIQQKPASPAIDLFAAGIVLWEMLCGRRLFQGADDSATVRAVMKCEVPTPSKLQRRIPKKVDALVLRALAKDPAARPPSCEHFAQEIDALLAELDPHVSSKDVGLIVNLYLAAEPPAPQPSADALLDLFTQELEAFVEGHAPDLGAAPLDPALFDQRRRY